jgi:hypothetical protein
MITIKRFVEYNIADSAVFANGLFLTYTAVMKQLESLGTGKLASDMSRSSRPDRRMIRLEGIAEWFKKWMK